MNPLGQILLAGRYQILEKLGQGGMGEVYKALDTHTENFVAIKQLRATISNDETIIERFRREGQALSDLNHPNIVKMLDMIQQDNEYFLVTEFLGGGDLANYLRQVGKMPLTEALRMGLELADALSRAHHLGIIHRDIKPANVLLANDGTPRLTDFGVAHLASQERLTGTGIAIGTMDYLPPEAVNGEAVDVRADVWSFGVMLYEMLTGTRPFAGSTTMQLLHNILTHQPPDVPEASPELNQLLRQMLQKDRSQRIRSARQVGASLEAILDGDTNSLQALQSPSTPSPRTEHLPDLPTTPGLAKKMNKPLQSSRRRGRFGRKLQRENTAGQQMRFLGFGFAIALLGIIGVGGGFFLSFASLFQPAPTITPSPEPTATTAPIAESTESLPDGFRRVTIGDVGLIVPELWASFPIDLFLQVSDSIMGGAAGNEAARNFLNLQSEIGLFGSLIDFSGAAVMIEDTGIVLSVDVLQERLDEMTRHASSGFQFIEELHPVDTHLGEALYAKALIAFGNNSSRQIQLDFFMIYRETRLYSIGFSTPTEKLEENRAIIDTIFNSVEIGINAEASLIIPNMPEGWKIAQGEHTAFAVPEHYLTATGDNQLMLNGSFLFVFGSQEAASSVSQMFETLTLDALAGDIEGDDLMFIGSLLQENDSATDLETAGALVQGLFSMIDLEADIDVNPLPARDVRIQEQAAILTEAQIIVPNRPPFTIYYYVTIAPNGQDIYGLALTFLESESETMSVLAEQIAQTFMILD